MLLWLLRLRLGLWGLHTRRLLPLGLHRWLLPLGLHRRLMPLGLHRRLLPLRLHRRLIPLGLHRRLLKERFLRGRRLVLQMHG